MLIGVIGNIGSGKTILAVRYAKKDYENGRNIISNIKLIGIPYKPFNIEEFLDNKYNELLTNATVILDELTMYMDCRLGSSKQNLLMGYLVLQSRKRGIDIYATMQSLDLVDFKRFVKYLNIIVFCKKMYVERFGKIKELETHREYSILEMDKQQNNITQFTMDIRPFFKYYDTNEIVTPVMQLKSKHERKTN